MSRSRRNDCGFTILELVGSTAVLILLIGCFYTSLRGVYGLQRVFEAETHAIVVIHNVLERIESEETKDADKVKAIFEDEFRKSAIAGRPEFTPVCLTENGMIAVRVMKRNGKMLAGVELMP